MPDISGHRDTRPLALSVLFAAVDRRTDQHRQLCAGADRLGTARRLALPCAAPVPMRGAPTGSW